MGNVASAGEPGQCWDREEVFRKGSEVSEKLLCSALHFLYC